MRAFAFDIDGVLLRGGRLLPGATKTLEKLNSRRVPWIVLTNGGGTLERDRCAELSERLGVKVDERQFLQSHTPFRDFVGANNRVLAIGGKQDSVRTVAETYGFKDVVMTRDITGSVPDVFPFRGLTGLDARTDSRKIDPKKSFDAIFVFHDSYDISTDSQIVIDLLLSQNGVLGTRREPSSYANQPSIPIYFSNGDLQWATDYTLPRFGQGAFIKTVLSLYEAVTEGQKLTHTVIGKPTILTYKYADKLLRQWAGVIGAPKPESVFMIGDNQYSDIKGANAFGWQSVLVRSGVYKDGDDLFTSPTYIEDDVYKAVSKALGD